MRAAVFASGSVEAALTAWAARARARARVMGAPNRAQPRSTKSRLLGGARHSGDREPPRRKRAHRREAWERARERARATPVPAVHPLARSHRAQPRRGRAPERYPHV
jgi:hypothetical protein